MAIILRNSVLAFELAASASSTRSVHALLEAFVDGTRVDLAVAGPELPRGASVMESRVSVPGGRLEVFAV